MKILAIDLGKFKSVACLFDTETNQAESETIAMQQVILEDLLPRKQPQKVVIEACTNSNWVDDICQEHGYEVLVANPNQEAWQWRNVKRKTDKEMHSNSPVPTLGKIPQNPGLAHEPNQEQYAGAIDGARVNPACSSQSLDVGRASRIE